MNTTKDSLLVTNRSQWEKILYLTGASVLYAGIDYTGYNLTRNNNAALTVYRIFQVAVQGAITYFLYKEIGLPTAIAFNVIWWTFGDDILYYGYSELVNPGGRWESRGSFSANVMGNHATWAYWTPIGIVRGMKRDQPIAGDTLIAQSLFGLEIALTITITL